VDQSDSTKRERIIPWYGEQVKYQDGRGPLPPAGIHRRPWQGPSATARRLGRTQTALYRFFASDGRLLYIGITVDIATRWQSHAGSAPWWHLQASHTVEYYAHRADAEAAERAAVRIERPLYNVVYAEPGTGRKGALAYPEVRNARPARAASERGPIEEPWRPTDEQSAALDAVTAAAAEVDAHGKALLPALHTAIAAAWALDVPTTVVAAHSRKEVST